MNLFLLDADPIESATAHCDRHVVKMVLETAQILCSAHWLCDGTIGAGWYKPTHTRHPVVQWAAEQEINYNYAYQQFAALAAEYEYRYGKTHLSWTKLGAVLKSPPWLIDATVPPSAAHWKFVQCMPTKYWEGNTRTTTLDKAIQSYRRYYRHDKQHLFTWTGRVVPDWLKM